MRALHMLQRESAASPFVFTTTGFAKMVERAGTAAGFDFKALA
jgi:hypothetical protein